MVHLHRRMCALHALEGVCLHYRNKGNDEKFQGFSRVGSNLVGRVASGDPTRPARFSRRLDPTRPDSRDFRDVLTRPDPRDFEIVLTRPDPTRHNLGDPRDSGRLAGHVNLTRNISHGSKHVHLGQSMYTSVGWLVLGPSYFSQYVVFSSYFTGIVCS